MPINDSRIREIILEEVQSIEERCLRYRERLEDAINEIIDLERVPPSNIQQEISDTCNRAGRWLATPDTEDGKRPEWHRRKRLY